MKTSNLIVDIFRGFWRFGFLSAPLVVELFSPCLAFAQGPQPTSLSVNRNSLPQGACYILAVENGSGVILDVQYTFNSGPVQVIRGWPRLDNSGRANICTGSTTPIGTYVFVAIRNTLNADWVSVEIPVAVTPLEQPTFLSVSPNTVSQGGYVLHVENGADMTLDVQYAFNTGPVQTIRGWPRLDRDGRAYICTTLATSIGDYFFLAIRNTLNPDWVSVAATVTATPAHPLSFTPEAKEPLSKVIQRALAVHGDGWVSGKIVDSVSEGTMTFYTVTGPQATFNMTLLVKGNQKVQRIIRQPNADHRIGTDGVQTWASLSIGFIQRPLGPGQGLHFIESQTPRSIQNLFNYQAEGLILRDLGMNDNARVIEAEDRDGRRTSYFVDVNTWTITRLEFIVGQSRDPFNGRQVPTVDTFIFSDFRVVQGVLTPFKIERYINRLKLEEMLFSSVLYNMSVPDDAFRP